MSEIFFFPSRRFSNTLKSSNVVVSPAIVPVLGSNGSHRDEPRIDKPLFGSKSRRMIENFTRVETFGHPDAHWVRAIVEPDKR